MEQFIHQFFGEPHLVLWMKLAALIFLAVLFLQSGLDKITDRAGNLEWLKGHFGNSPFKNSVPLLLTLVTLLEMGAGLCSAVGTVTLAMFHNPNIGILGVMLSMKAILVLFIGQRIAKDYEGASTLASYFLLTMFVMYLFTI